jgi:hypothetical protein
LSHSASSSCVANPNMITLPRTIVKPSRLSRIALRHSLASVTRTIRPKLTSHHPSYQLRWGRDPLGPDDQGGRSVNHFSQALHVPTEGASHYRILFAIHCSIAGLQGPVPLHPHLFCSGSKMRDLDQGQTLYKIPGPTSRNKTREHFEYAGVH